MSQRGIMLGADAVLSRDDNSRKEFNYELALTKFFKLQLYIS